MNSGLVVRCPATVAYVQRTGRPLSSEYIVAGLLHWPTQQPCHDTFARWQTSARGDPPTPPWRQPGGRWMVSLVNSHTNAVSKRWHLWEIDLRFALNSTPGWCGDPPMCLATMQGSCARKKAPATPRQLHLFFLEQRFILLSIYFAGSSPGVETVQIVGVGCLEDRGESDLVVLPHALDRAVPVELLHLHGQVLRASGARLRVETPAAIRQGQQNLPRGGAGQPSLGAVCQPAVARLPAEVLAEAGGLALHGSFEVMSGRRSRWQQACRASNVPRSGLPPPGILSCPSRAFHRAWTSAASGVFKLRARSDPRQWVSP